MEGLKPGRIVYFVFDEQTAMETNRRRTGNIGAPGWSPGAQAHVGNSVAAGEIAPAMVVRVWSDVCVNLKVMLDGTDVYWATSVSYAEDKRPRSWHWMFEGQAGRYDATKAH